MKQLLLTAILTALSVAASIKLSDEGWVGCKNIVTQASPVGPVTLKRCFGKLVLKKELIDISELSQ